MPTFDTPSPIVVTIEVGAGSVRLSTDERADTVVDIRPHDPDRAADVRAAEQARVDYRTGMLTVAAGRRGLSLGRGGAVDIDIALPARSSLQASSASANVTGDGSYAGLRFASASGDLRLENVTGNIKADTASGDITVESLVGDGTISTASGDARIGRLDGDVKFQAASGGLTVGTLRGHVTVQTASGSATVNTAVQGGFTVQSGSGVVQVGIPAGTAARLDLKTHSGTVDNALQASAGPADGDDTVAVRARTGSGDIAVRRASGPVAA